jgi:hypothetical protein
MKEHPILFSTPMVQAIIEGHKTMTRRIIKPQPIDIDDYCGENPDLVGISNGKTSIQCNELQKIIHCPYGQKGDMLWVRETFAIVTSVIQTHPISIFKANYPDSIEELTSYMLANNNNWKPSIHMPKSSARIWLQITDIRVERLQDITNEDAIAEGIESAIGVEKMYRVYTVKNGWTHDAIGSFSTLWMHVNGHESAKSNPWVWVVSFKVLSTTGRPETLAHFSSL